MLFELGKSDGSVYVFGEWVHCESWGAGASLPFLVAKSEDGLGV